MKVDELLSKKEVAARLGVSTRTVTELMRSRAISYVKLGRSVRFEWARVEADLAKATVKKEGGMKLNFDEAIDLVGITRGEYLKERQIYRSFRNGIVEDSENRRACLQRAWRLRRLYRGLARATSPAGVEFKGREW